MAKLKGGMEKDCAESMVVVGEKGECKRLSTTKAHSCFAVNRLLVCLVNEVFK